MKKNWINISASEAREITNDASRRKLDETKDEISERIYCAAYLGKDYLRIDFEYYEVSCLEDWCNIYNWLLNLGYTIEDKSKKRYFIVTW